MVSVEWFIPGIADDGSRDKRQVDIAIRRQHKVRNQYFRQLGAIEVVAELELSRVLSVDIALKLQRGISQPCFE